MIGRYSLCCVKLATVCVVCGSAMVYAEPFASQVMAYDPAPGQFVNDSFFNDAAKALGAPEGVGTFDGNVDSVVTLGGFGGYIVLAFDDTVMDDPLNPFGMDAIVFGNAFWVGSDDQRHWAEPAVIEISVDANANGLADDVWYLIPGSHITNPNGQWLDMTWDDDTADATYPPDFASWLPTGRTGVWITASYALPGDVFSSSVIVNPSQDSNVEGIFGYGDWSPTLLLGDLDADNVIDDFIMLAEEFYTKPDDPMVAGITAGSGGGDAFDIAWAINPSDGSPAELSGFDFIRLTNGVHALQGPLGEKSPEIDAVADVTPDPFGDMDSDGDIDLLDAKAFVNCFMQPNMPSVQCMLADRETDGLIGLTDSAAFVDRLMGPL